MLMKLLSLEFILKKKVLVYIFLSALTLNGLRFNKYIKRDK